MADNFDTLWNQHIKPLVGKPIDTIAKKKENRIVEVTDGYLRRLGSKGNISPKIPKKLFKEIYNRLLKEKIITRTQINSDYQGRRSSIVVAILKELPNIEAKKKSSTSRIYSRRIMINIDKAFNIENRNIFDYYVQLGVGFYIPL